jgi:hypothetical protein
VTGTEPIGFDIGTAHMEFRDPPASFAPAASAASEASESAAPHEATLRTVTGARAQPVVPDLATTGALFSLLAFGGLGLLFATRLHRFKVLKVRG